MCRLAAKRFKCGDDVDVVVAIDSLRIPAKCPEFVGKTVHIELIHRSLALSQAVHVDDGIQIGSFVIARQCGGFPNRTFRAFAITEQDISVERDPVELRSESIAESGRKSLAEGTSGHIDPRHSRSRMSLEIAVQPAQREQILFFDDPGFRIRGHTRAAQRDPSTK